MLGQLPQQCRPGPRGGTAFALGRHQTPPSANTDRWLQGRTRTPQKGRNQAMETWDLWFPDSGATGLAFARGRLDPTDVLWVHAAPPSLNVTVRDADERV